MKTIIAAAGLCALTGASALWAQEVTPLSIKDFKRITPVALAPTARVDPVATALTPISSQRPVARPIPDAVFAPAAPKSMADWSDAEVIAGYEAAWADAQTAATRAEVKRLADDMGTLWDIMGARNLRGAVAAPDFRSVGWYLEEVGLDQVSAYN